MFLFVYSDFCYCLFIWIFVFFSVLQWFSFSKMKTFFVVVLAVVATTYATSVPLEGKSSDAANLDPVADTEGQIPVEVVYANQKDDEGSSTGGRRDKRFLFSKFLLAKAAFGAGWVLHRR